VGARDWFDEFRVEVLLQHPIVRDRIDRYAASASIPRSSEEVAWAMGGQIAAGMTLGRLFGNRMGLSVNRERAQSFGLQIGRVIVAVLCSLARNAERLQHIQQMPDGCVLHAEIPSDYHSWAGTLTVVVRRDQLGTYVGAKTHIAGQKFDSGKSDRMLATLFGDIPAMAALDDYL
jgi:hypothetical protein